MHDRIREASQSLLPETQRAQLHLRTAQLLLERLSEPEQHARCFEVAHHLCRAAGQIPAEMRVSTIEWHQKAGAAALQSGAPASAAHYLAAALHLFQEADWTERAQLGFDLHLSASECAYQTREFERALELLAPLEARPFSRMQSARVAAQGIKVYALSRSIEETLDRTLAELRKIGAPLPRRPSRLRARWAVARTDWLLRSAPESWALRPYPGGDPSCARARARAARSAEDALYTHHAALAHERRAQLLSALGHEPDADHARVRARDHYRASGADAKVRALG